MKTMKYLLLGALVLSSSAAVKAQEGASAAEQVKEILKNKPADADKQIKAIYKKNKKDMEAVVGIARAFYEANDTANAHVYAQYAADKNYPAAYLLLGDIQAKGDHDVPSGYLFRKAGRWHY